MERLYRALYREPTHMSWGTVKPPQIHGVMLLILHEGRIVRVTKKDVRVITDKKYDEIMETTLSLEDAVIKYNEYVFERMLDAGSSYKIEEVDEARYKEDIQIDKKIFENFPEDSDLFCKETFAVKIEDLSSVKDIVNAIEKTIMKINEEPERFMTYFGNEEISISSFSTVRYFQITSDLYLEQWSNHSSLYSHEEYKERTNDFIMFDSMDDVVNQYSSLLFGSLDLTFNRHFFEVFEIFMWNKDNNVEVSLLIKPHENIINNKKM